MSAFPAIHLVPGVVLLAMTVSGCSAIVIAADAAVSAGVAVVGTAADITVAGVKAVTGGGSDDSGKSENADPPQPARGGVCYAARGTGGTNTRG